MNMLGQRTFAQALREWIDRDETGGNAERVARFVVEKALAGHFAYFKFIIDLVDGKLRQTTEDELTFEADCVVVAGNRELEVERSNELAKAA